MPEHSMGNRSELRRAIHAIKGHQPSVPLVQDLLEQCGFSRRARKEPYQRIAPDGSGVLALPKNEKPLAFFPVVHESPRWKEDVYPNVKKCWDPTWTGWNGGIGRTFLVTPKAMLAYVLPLRPREDREVEPARSLDFSKAQEWSENLVLLTADFTSAGSYWEFLTTPTATMRVAVDQRLVGNLEAWAEELASHLAQAEPNITAEQATRIIRSSLDQLLFIRFCEDRRVTRLEQTLFDFTRGTIRWTNLKDLVQEYRRILNGDIFTHDVFQKKYHPEGFIQKILLALYQDFCFETIPSDILGRTYERTLTKRLDWRPPRARLVEDKERRKEFGIYYTPEPVARYLAERAIEIWREKAGKDLREVKIFDPCAGSGTFLVQAMWILFKHLGAAQQGGLSIEERAEILERNIFGMDREQAPLERSAFACYFEALSGRGVAAGEHLLPHLLGSNLRIGDATDLRASAGIVEPDIILLNPPYTRHRQDNSPCWNIIRQSIETLPENGLLATIVPDAVLRNKRLVDLRKKVLATCAIEEFGLIRCQVFQDPTVRPTLLIARKVSDPVVRDAHQPKTRQIEAISPVWREKTISRTLSQSVFKEDVLCRFTPHVPDTLHELSNQLRTLSCFVPLSNYFRVIQVGLIAPRRFVEKVQRHGKAGSGFKPFLEGRDILPFVARWASKYVDYEAVVTAYQKEKRQAGAGRNIRADIRPRNPELFEIPCKLLVRRSGSWLRAALDFGKHYADDKVVVFVPDRQKCSSLDLHYLLGYLNCEISWFWLRQINPQDLALQPQWRQADIQNLLVAVRLHEMDTISIALLAHRISQCLASGYFDLEQPKIIAMRRQLLARFGRALHLSEDDVNHILDFLDEDISAPYRPFRYPRRMPPLEFIELPDRPIARGRKTGDLLDTAPPSDEERRRRDEWEDRINGPLPDIYEIVPDSEQTRLVDRLEEFSNRLDGLEEMLKKKME
jgi:hypothetical protein